MKKGPLILTLFAGILLWGSGAPEARAGQIILPAPLSDFVPPPATNSANYAIVGNLEFLNFGYTQTTGAPPAASGVTVNPFTLVGPPAETGLQFVGAFNAAAGTTQDWAITYEVKALSGKITDAYLAFTGGVFAGTGSISITESITTLSGAPLVTPPMEASIPGSTVASASWAGVTAILVTKDISVIGGSNGATVSVINQGFSGSSVPEPASYALLGIGMTGFLALRRFFKKTSVA
jgi:hypothetical protein